MGCVELSSAVYRATLVDGVSLVGPSALASLTLTLTNLATGAVINARSAQNILNTNGVRVYDTLQTDADGVTYNLKWTLVPADNPIVNDDLAVETHIALFVAAWTGGGCQHVVSLPVKNLVRAA